MAYKTFKSPDSFEYVVRDLLGAQRFSNVWDVVERDGHLWVYSNDGVLAIYAPGQWKSVERRS